VRRSSWRRGGGGGGAGWAPCAAALGALLLVPGPATAQDADLRPSGAVVADLTGEDWRAARAAREEAARIGARVVPAALAARAAAPLDAAIRRPLDDVVRGVVAVLAREAAAPLTDPEERVLALGALGGLAGPWDPSALGGDVPELGPDDLGDLGSVRAETPLERTARRRRGRRARGALVLLGPAVTGALLAAPPVRPVEVQRALVDVVERIYARERERALAGAARGDAAAFRADYRGLADLAAPVVALGVRDDEAAVRAAFQAIRDEAVDGAVAALDAPGSGARQAAADALLRLGALARPQLERVARAAPGEASVAAREGAARLVRRIRYGLSDELVRRLGDDLAGYAELPFRERRARVIELERLGGPAAVPALRALLREEPSEEVRVAAAIGLHRLDDPVGTEWLRLHGQGVPFRISRRELAAVFMDQGLRALQLGRYGADPRELRQVLELEPTNEIAWYNLACTYSLWGRIDDAIAALERAVEYGWDDVSHMADDDDLDPIRDDERFRRLVDRIEARRSSQ